MVTLGHLKLTIFWNKGYGKLIPTLLEVMEEKLVGGPFCLHPEYG